LSGKFRETRAPALVGEAPALKVKENTLVRELDSLSVECLPGDIPTSVELDLTQLTEAEQAIRVKDIRLGEEVTVSNDPEVVVVKISSRPVEVVEEVVAEQVAVEEAAAAAPEAKEAGPSPEEELSSE
jgi:large subunit ribosomal protein L25